MVIRSLVPYICHDVVLDVMVNVVLDVEFGSGAQDRLLVQGVASHPCLSAATVDKYWDVFQPETVTKSVVTGSSDPNIVEVLLRKDEQRVSVLESMVRTWKLPVSQAELVVERWPETSVDRLVGLFSNYPASLLVDRVSEMEPQTQLRWLVEGGCAHVGEDQVWDILVDVAASKTIDVESKDYLKQILCLYPGLRSLVVSGDNRVLWDCVVHAPLSSEELGVWVSRIVGLVLNSDRDVLGVALGVLRRPDLDDDMYMLLRETLAERGDVPVRLLGPTVRYRPMRGKTLAECNDPEQVLTYLQQLHSGWFMDGLPMSVVLYLLGEIASNPVVWEHVELRKFIQQETKWSSLRGSLQSVPPEIVPVLQELYDMPWDDLSNKPDRSLAKFLLTGPPNQDGGVVSEPLRYYPPVALTAWETSSSELTNGRFVGQLTPQDIDVNSAVSPYSLAVWLTDQLKDGSTPESKQRWVILFLLLPEWEHTFQELVNITNKTN